MTALARSAPAPRARAHAQAKARPPLRALDRPVRQPGGDRRLVAMVSGGLLFAAVLAGNVAVHAETTQGQFELERLEKTARERQAHYQRLRLEVAQLEAPKRIVARARQLGMVEAGRVSYLTPTAATTSEDPATRSPRGPSPDGEAAGSWAQVKPHLARQR